MVADCEVFVSTRDEDGYTFFSVLMTPSKVLTNSASSFKMKNYSFIHDKLYSSI